MILRPKKYVLVLIVGLELLGVSQSFRPLVAAHHRATVAQPAKPPCPHNKGQSSATSCLGMTLLEPETALNLVVATALGFGTDPFVETVFNSTKIENTGTEDADFRHTFVYGAADSIAVAARVYGAAFLVGIAAELLDYRIPMEPEIPVAAREVAFIVWAALTVSEVKRVVFLQAIAGTALGRVALYNRLIDFLIGLAAVVLCLDALSIEAGMGIQSVLAGSGVGAIVFSLASQNLAQQIVGGFVVQSWDAFEVGDNIKLGDGTEGTVKKIGLVETEIDGYDNISIRIPNSQIASQRVSNLSRVQKSQVRQELRFSYDDLDKLPSALEDIKSEIRRSCNELITDGSKPFQALLLQYQADHVQAVVNCHFDLRPGSAEYFDNQQQVLLAIARALKRNNVKFALPSIVYQTSEDAVNTI